MRLKKITAAFAVALLLAVFAPRPAHAVMGTCTTFALSTADLPIPLCTAAANTACVGGVPAANRRQLVLFGDSTIIETVNWGAVVVSLSGYRLAAGNVPIVVSSSQDLPFGQPGVTTATYLGPTMQMHAIAASATPNLTVCEF